jgi:hypothetical protein
MPLTAEDVAFTFTYAHESGLLGNPAGVGLGDLIASYAPSPYRAILEFDTESYWLFSNFAYDSIIPEHIFNDDTGIGYAGWDDWNPVFSADPHVTSGPFRLTSYQTGDWYELTPNPLFYYPLPNPAPVIAAIADFSYVVGTTGNEIHWEVSDDNPLSYVVMKDLNVTPVASGLWNGSDIIVNVDGLAVGSYNYTLALIDYSANFVMDSVVVTVVEAGTTTTSSTGGGGLLEGDTLTIIITVGAIGAILVIAVLFYKTKQT